MHFIIKARLHDYMDTTPDFLQVVYQSSEFMS